VAIKSAEYTEQKAFQQTNSNQAIHHFAQIFLYKNKV